ncbi:hypothetical protein [Microlunatus flavus]|uniref:Uncharacterized protein n=1 Tax=Microlunatus flavus TaxID=1036181 RepID=A0A1H9N0L5_9ACTN|nr:hypothetical protein [Microlunatus flavus]SER29205.1 hypothetical protein SAMN05421756_11220 [Microlunatus flavus]
MRGLFRARGLPSDAYASWRDSLSSRPGAPVRILAWARADEDFVVGSPALLSLGGDAQSAEPEPVSDQSASDGSASDESASTGTASARSAPARDAWRHVGWHQIEHGGWNAESRSLSWTLYGGRRGRVALREAGRMPELFRERVAASIVVERFVPIRGERGVTVTARRDLGGSGEVTWHSTLTRGLSWSAEGVADEVARASAELQSEYGSSSRGW